MSKEVAVADKEMMKKPTAKYKRSSYIRVCTVHFYCRIEFTQPDHVLQVAAAVAQLKEVTLKQVHNNEGKFYTVLWAHNVVHCLYDIF